MLKAVFGKHLGIKTKAGEKSSAFSCIMCTCLRDRNLSFLFDMLVSVKFGGDILIFIDISGAGAAVRRQEILTCGMVGAVCSFRFNEEWDSLSKTAVFRQGDTVKDAVCIDNTAVIPWEVLRVPGAPLEIGVYGTNSDVSTVIPTVWVKTRPLLPGADPSGDPSVEPTPGAWEQMAAMVGSKVDKAEGTPGNLVIFGEDGTIADGGEIPKGGEGTPSFYLVYDDTGASYEKNKASIKAILEAHSAGKPFAVFIKDYETIAPAQLEVLSNGCEISYKEGGYKSIIKYYKSTDRIAYTSEGLYSSSFSETGIIPASQRATAEWVKSYVDSTLLIDTEVVL